MSRMRSVMKHQFSQVPRANIPRSRFDRSHGHKTAFDAGQLIPIYVDEALPADTFNLKLNAFARLATPLHPIMDNAYMDFHFFAVPIRLIWDNWEKFNGAQDNPEDSTDYLVPQFNAGAIPVGSIPDYMGIPSGLNVANMANKPSSLWFRAYNLIWNEWFRDQNLQDSISVPKGDGPDTPATLGYTNLTSMKPLRRGKRHDYFTSCLPWPQKGPSVDIPLGSQAPVYSAQDDQYLRNVRDLVMETNSTLTFGATSGSFRNLLVDPDTASANSNAGAIDMTGAYADLTAATAATINQLRQAFQVQKLYERDARGGTRYTEILNSHFGVTSPDARLQRPEYLGGGSAPVHINPVANTAGDVSPQGNLAGFGTVNASGIGFNKSFTEHCIIIGLASVRADLTYQQGLNRMFSRQTRFDFYWPALSHIGEQAVLNKEIYTQGTEADEEVFGYQERFAEYRYKPSQITGLMRSTAPASLDVWHLSQKFDALPTLSKEFIQEDPPIDRVIAVPSEPHFIFDSYFDLKCARPLPVYGVPSLIDHF